MNNNTRVRVRISKDLFESLAKEVLAEAKKASGDHAMKLSKKMPKLGENKQMVKAKKMEEMAVMTKKEETRNKVTEIAKSQLAELMKKKHN